MNLVLLPTYDLPLFGCKRKNRRTFGRAISFLVWSLLREAGSANQLRREPSFRSTTIIPGNSEVRVFGEKNVGFHLAHQKTTEFTSSGKEPSQAHRHWRPFGGSPNK